MNNLLPVSSAPTGAPTLRSSLSCAPSAPEGSDAGFVAVVLGSKADMYDLLEVSGN